LVAEGLPADLIQRKTQPVVARKRPGAFQFYLIRDRPGTRKRGFDMIGKIVIFVSFELAIQNLPEERQA
jgi:hypothetical protein